MRASRHPFILLVLLAQWSAVQVSFAAETVTVGFVDLPKELNFIDGTRISEQFLRSSVTLSLIRAISPMTPAQLNATSGLEAAQSMHVSRDLKNWVFVLATGLNFQNGNPVQEEDVLFSIARCHHVGSFGGLNITAKRRSNSLSQARGSVTLQIKVKDSSAKLEYDTVVDAITRCPIVEKESSQVFGRELGKGTNIVAAGPYVIERFVRGKEYNLRRWYQPGESRLGAETLHVRGFDKPDQALTALRAGTVDGVIMARAQTPPSALGDPTLVSKTCSYGEVLFRVGLNFECGVINHPTRLRYLE